MRLAPTRRRGTARRSRATPARPRAATAFARDGPAWHAPCTPGRASFSARASTQARGSRREARPQVRFLGRGNGFRPDGDGGGDGDLLRDLRHRREPVALRLRHADPDHGPAGLGEAARCGDRGSAALRPCAGSCGTRALPPVLRRLPRLARRGPRGDRQGAEPRRAPPRHRGLGVVRRRVVLDHPQRSEADGDAGVLDRPDGRRDLGRGGLPEAPGTALATGVRRHGPGDRHGRAAAARRAVDRGGRPGASSAPDAGESGPGSPAHGGVRMRRVPRHPGRGERPGAGRPAPRSLRRAPLHRGRGVEHA